MNHGFGLIEVLIAVAIITLLFGGGKWLTKGVKERKTTVEIGLEAKGQAEAIKKLLESRNQQLLNE